MTVDAILNSAFVQVALPIVSTIWAGVWIQNKRFDDVNRRLDKIDGRLDRIEMLLPAHDQRITRLEERTSLVR